LVLRHFSSAAPQKSCHHVDGDRANVKIGNLRWGTKIQYEKIHRVKAPKVKSKTNPVKSVSVAEKAINPDHYTIGGIETWDYIKAKYSPSQAAGFALGSAMKYISRCNHKNKLEDLKKARKFLDMLITEIESSNNQDKYFK